MPILRRYVRVSKYTVLEARIFLPNPADVPWFTRTGALERVFAEVKHLVLPMLAEARNLRGGAARIKAKETEIVNGEDFEASLYLTGSGTLHAVLRKDRNVQVKQPIRSNSSTLMDAARSSPIIIREEEEEEEEADMHPIPGIQEIPEAPAGGEDEHPLFLPGPNDQESDSDGEFVPLSETPAAARKKRSRKEVDEETSVEATKEDTKKKLKFRTEYEGFTIYDKVLCLVVSRKEKKKGKAASQEKAGLIEGWIVMSQAVRNGDVDGGDGGEDKEGE